MSKLTKYALANKKNRILAEAEEEVPVETEDADLEDLELGDVEGVEDIPEEDGITTSETEVLDDETETEKVEDVPPVEVETDTVDETAFTELDQYIQGMVGVTELNHTTSSTIIDFEDGGQLMFVHPMVSMQTDTINKIIELINIDVEKAFAFQKDEITGKPLKNTKYWLSVKTLISTMVRSQLTKSDNLDGLIDETKQIFKILGIK